MIEPHFDRRILRTTKVHRLTNLQAILTFDDTVHDTYDILYNRNMRQL